MQPTAAFLRACGLKRVAAVHAGLEQPKRLNAIDFLRNEPTAVLVATDGFARGLDIPSVSHVINYDLPSSLEVYVHRIGRTGRAGREGAAMLL